MGDGSGGDEAEGPERGKGARGDLAGHAGQQAPEGFGQVRFEVEAVFERVVRRLDAVAEGAHEGVHHAGPGVGGTLLPTGRQQMRDPLLSVCGL